MTFQALQEYLDVVKWKDSEKIRAGDENIVKETVELVKKLN